MRKKVRRLAGALALAGLTLSPIAAQAKGLLLFNTGDELFEVAPLPLEMKGRLPTSFKLGYTCKRFGIFWADAWTWDCKLSAVNPERDEYADPPSGTLQKLESQYSMSDAKRSFWNQYGFGVLLVLVAAMFAWPLVFRGKEKLALRESS